MGRRHSIPRRVSKRLFRKTAGNQRVHPKNSLNIMPMRGGIRL